MIDAVHLCRGATLGNRDRAGQDGKLSGTRLPCAPWAYGIVSGRADVATVVPREGEKIDRFRTIYVFLREVV